VITRALVTGASGFVGRHLAMHLSELGTDVIGAARERPDDWASEWRQLDVRDSGQVEAIIQDLRPTVVFHLACADRGAPLDDLLEVNVGGTGRLLAAVARSAPETRVVVPGSSAEYGLAPPSELPIDEHAALRPVGAYGVSKCAQSLLALAAAARADADVVVARTFNLVGPGEPATLVCGAFASQIAMREAGAENDPITVGNLDSMRDFVDVRDAVRAYVLAAMNGSGGEVYNVCSGAPARISDILRMLIAKARTPIDVLPSTGGGSADVPVQFGDPSRLRAATGWTPGFTLEQSLEALLDSWRAKLRCREASRTTSGD